MRITITGTVKRDGRAPIVFYGGEAGTVQWSEGTGYWQETTGRNLASALRKAVRQWKRLP